MYLLTFVFLMIGMLGIYTQVYAVQAARMFSHHQGVGDMMLSWHEAASSLAENVINTTTTPISPTGCSMTFGLTAVPYCPKGNGPLTTGALNVTVTGSGLYSANGSPYPQLPPFYNSARYAWETVAYQTPAGAYYLVTFVPPPTITAANPAPGYVSSMTKQLNITASDLYQEIQQTGIPLYSFGWVSTVAGVRTLNTPPILTGGTPASIPVSYPLPSVIPDQSLAIISSPSHCAAC